MKYLAFAFWGFCVLLPYIILGLISGIILAKLF